MTPAPTCASTFDRWRCTLPPGHTGDHCSHAEQQTARWNDNATGSSLRRFGRPTTINRPSSPAQQRNDVR